jgi:circadian clock protein KaiC
MATPATVAAKLRTGIAGFDDISGGGLPRNRATLLLGGPGSGKSVFALQTLVVGARDHGEPGIFVAFEEDCAQVMSNAASFGWDVQSLAPERLFFLDARPDPGLVQSGDFDISALLSVLQAKAREIGARRVVFDGIDMLLDLLDNQAAERRELSRLHRWLQDSGMTGLITAKMTGQSPAGLDRYGYLQFMADCVVVFHHRVSDTVALRGVRIHKYRGSAHSANEFPMIISSDGVRVARYSAAELAFGAPIERVPTGIGALDEMSAGGFFKGSCVLVSGAPGTAKTTLAAAFVQAACRRNERCLYVSFDEAGASIIRNLRSVNIDLQPLVDSKLLRIYAIRTGAHAAEAHLIHVQDLIDEHRPDCLVVDPVSSLVHAGGTVLATDATVRLVDVAKARNITSICTSLTNSTDALVEDSLSNISTIADVWIHLSYVIRDGKRNRALTVVKARGSKHSNQVRELLLSDHGVSLAAISDAGGGPR